MTYEQMIDVNNVIRKEVINGIQVNFFTFENKTGWWSEVNGNKYGNFIENGGQWKNKGEDITTEELHRINAAESIRLIKTK
jgi:hypothetical protein